MLYMVSLFSFFMFLNVLTVPTVCNFSSGNVFKSVIDVPHGPAVPDSPVQTILRILTVPSVTIIHNIPVAYYT